MNAVSTPLQPQQLPATPLFAGTEKINRESRVSPGARALLLLTVPLLSGCGARGARAHVRDRIPAEQSQKFWTDCQQTVAANNDGFKHFVCHDTKGKQWEVLCRLEPTK